MAGMENDDNKKRPLLRSVLEQQPEYVKAIGLISIETNNLETFLAAMLGGVIGVRPDVATVIYLTPKSSAARLQILENAVEFCLVKNDARVGIEKLIKRAYGIFTKRHGHMHSRWGHRDGKIHRRDSPAEADMKAIPVELRELEEVVRDIRVLIEDVMRATDALYKHQSSRKKAE